MTTLIVGELSAGLQQQLATMLELGGCKPAVVPDLEAARARLHDEETPQATILHVDAPGARDFVRWVRRQSPLFGMPLFAVVDWACPSEFQRASALGVDDVVVDGDRVGLLRRARVLSSLEHLANPEPRRGRCLIEHPDPTRRVVVGRLLLQAGFDARFVGSVEELLEAAKAQPPPALVVLADKMTMPEAIARIAKVRRAAGRADLPCVAALSAEDVTRARVLIHHGLEGIALLQDGASSTEVLFLVNELLSSQAAKTERVSRRLLFETLIAFREADSEQASYGLTYNASRGGLYVRSFNQPPRGTHLEVRFRPPHHAAALTLAGRVAWLRPPGGSGDSTAPIGFGIELLPAECAPRDWTTFLESVQVAEATQPEPPHLEAATAAGPRPPARLDPAEVEAADELEAHAS